MKIALVQCRVGRFSDFRSFSLLLDELDEETKFVCFPEYFVLSTLDDLDKAKEESRVASENLVSFSKQVSLVVVGGSVLEESGGKLFNACNVYDRGKVIFSYRKVFPTSHEKDLGIISGNGFSSFHSNGVNSSILICNDILFPSCSAGLAKLHPDLVFVPLVSPLRAHDPTRNWRDYLFAVRAFEFSSFIVKVGMVGKRDGVSFAGRSSVSAPWGLMWKSTDEKKELVKTIELDFNKLEEYRRTDPLLRINSKK